MDATATLLPLPLTPSQPSPLPTPPRSSLVSDTDHDDDDDNNTTNDSANLTDLNRLVVAVPAVATFAAVAAAAVLWQQPSSSPSSPSSQQQQPLLHILLSSNHQINKIRLPVNHCDVNAIQSITLPDLENLLTVLSTAQPWEAGHAPGFFTQPPHSAFSSYPKDWPTNNNKNSNNNRVWPYQTLPLDAEFERHNETVTTLPVPSPQALWHALTRIRTVWMERLDYLRNRCQRTSNDDNHINQHHANHHKDNYCSCITFWEHPNSLTMMANQVLEQVRTRTTWHRYVTVHSIEMDGWMDGWMAGYNQHSKLGD